MPKAYSYIRFSTPEQAKGDSLRRQTAQTEEWCRQRGVTLDDTLHDFGVSAFKGANRTTGALSRFLELVNSGRVEKGSYLIVESLDRLSREAVTEATSRLLDLIRSGITVVTLSDGQEYSHERLISDWTPLVYSLMVMARAHEESRMKSERVGAAWKRKKELARDERKPLTRRCPEWLAIEDGKFVLRPDRVEIVLRVFRETIEGAGRREVVRRLNEEGVPAFRGENGWHTSSIAKILQSRAVLGEYQPHKGTHRQGNREPDGEPILDFYPRILDDTTFWLAQSAIQGRRKGAAGRKGNAVHLLQGVGFCSSCSNPMHIVNKGKPPKGGIYLQCSVSMRHAGCENSRRWRVDRLEKNLLTGLGFLDPDIFGSLDVDSIRAREVVAALKAQVEEKTQIRTRLLNVVRKTDDEAAQEEFATVAAELKALKRDLKAAEAEAAKGAATPELSARIRDAAVLARQIEDTDPEKRRSLRIRLVEILRALVDRIECGPETGAVLVLKPKRRGFRLSGTVPFAIWMHALPDLECDADKTTSDDQLPALMELRMLIEETDERASSRFFAGLGMDFSFQDEAADVD